MRGRDGYPGPMLVGTVCHHHGRFHYECGCEPPKKEKHMAVVREPSRVGAVVRVDFTELWVRVQPTSPGSPRRWRRITDSPTMARLWQDITTDSEGDQVDVEVLFEGAKPHRPTEPTEPGSVVRARLSTIGSAQAPVHTYVRLDFSDGSGWLRIDNPNRRVRWESLTDIEILRVGV